MSIIRFDCYVNPSPSLPTQKAKGARKKKESKKKKVKAVQKKQYAGVDKEFMEQAHPKQGPGDIIIGTPPTTRHSTEIHMRGEGSDFPLPPLDFKAPQQYYCTLHMYSYTCCNFAL